MGAESNEGGVIPPRLRPIARELANGLENHEIADKCGLAKHTVEDYVHQLKEHFGEPNRVKLAMRCAQLVKNGEI
jgi:DNA-binding NarL/FixJ family response regulator